MDQMLVRRVSGFRVAAIVLLVIATITLVKSIFVPTHSVEIINKFNLLLNLMTMAFFGFVYQYLNEKNYERLVVMGVAVAFGYYIALEAMGSYDAQIRGLSKLGVGKILDYVFLAPLFFIVAHTLFFRKSIMYFAIIIYSCAVLYNIYQVISSENVYFSSSWQEVVADGNAINLPFFGVWLNIFITIAIMCWAIV